VPAVLLQPAMQQAALVGWMQGHQGTTVEAV
jgi:hypothetical protein